MPRPGTTASGASSASGSSAKRRSCRRGCGTVSPGSSTTRVAVEQQVEVDRPRAPALGRRGPGRARARRRAARRAARAARARSRAPTAPFRNGGWSTGPHGLGLAQRRDGDDLDARPLAEELDRAADRRLAVAEVRPQPDVGPHAATVAVNAARRRNLGLTAITHVLMRLRACSSCRSLAVPPPLVASLAPRARLARGPSAARADATAGDARPARAGSGVHRARRARSRRARTSRRDASALAPGRARRRRARARPPRARRARSSRSRSRRTAWPRRPRRPIRSRPTSGGSPRSASTA